MGDGAVVCLCPKHLPLTQKAMAVPVMRQERRIGGAQEVILDMAEDFNAPLDDFNEYMA